MDDNFQYFDSADLLHINGGNHLILKDLERETNTPVRLHSVAFGSSDSSKWFVTVIPDVGCKFRLRNDFDTEESAEAFAKSIQLLATKTGIQRIG